MSTRRKTPTEPATVTTEIPIQTIREPPSGPKLPTILKFPLVVLISFSLTLLANTVLVEFTGPKLYPVSRNLNGNWQAGVVVAWKVLELGVGWFAGFDFFDMLSFTFLTHLPHAYLLRTFYLVPVIPTIVFLFTELTALLPFYLLRRANPHHHSLLNNDYGTTILVTSVATAMYALPIVISLVTFLPVYFATYFDGLKTLDPAHDSTLYAMLLLLFPAGAAAYDFFFNPATTTADTIPIQTTDLVNNEKTILEFDPETATLTQTLHRNIFWHTYLPARTQEYLARVTLLTVWTIANTAFLAFTEVEGAEVFGALGWAGVWGVGSSAAGGMLAWVAGVAV